jgi:hypothetical protein
VAREGSNPYLAAEAMTALDRIGGDEAEAAIRAFVNSSAFMGPQRGARRPRASKQEELLSARRGVRTDSVLGPSLTLKRQTRAPCRDCEPAEASPGARSQPSDLSVRSNVRAGPKTACATEQR